MQFLVAGQLSQQVINVCDLPVDVGAVGKGLFIVWLFFKMSLQLEKVFLLARVPFNQFGR